MTNLDLNKSLNAFIGRYGSLRGNLTPWEIDKIYEMLELVSIQVEAKIIEGILSGDEEIASGMKKAQEDIKNRLAELEQKKQEQELSGELSQSDVVEKLQHQLQELERMQQCVSNPKKYIEEFIACRYPENESNTKIHELCGLCAISMADRNRGKTEMETSPVDGLPIFTHIKDDNGFDGYVPDGRRVESLLEIVRNPELCRELDSYGKANLGVKKKEDVLQNAKNRENYYKLISSALSNDMARKEVENDITRLAELQKKYNRLQSDSIALAEVPRGLWGRLISFINRGTNQKKLNEINEQKKNVSGEIEGVLNKFNSRNDKNNEKNDDYGIILDFYMGYDVFENRIDSFNRDPEKQIERASQLVEEGKRTSMRDFAETSARLKDKTDIASSDYNYAVTDLNIAKGKRDNIYSKLSPEAKKTIDSNGDYTTTNLTSKYIAERGTDRQNMSPIAALVILDGVIEAKKIQTPEDASKMGLVVTDGDMEKIRSTAQDMKGDMLNWLNSVNNREDGGRF